MSRSVPEPKTLPLGRFARLVACRVIISRGLVTMRIKVWGACLTILGIVDSKIAQLSCVRSSLVCPGFWPAPAVKMTRSVPLKSS